MRKERERYGDRGAEALPGREGRHTQKKNRGRDWSYVAISQGMHRFPINTGS